VAACKISVAEPEPKEVAKFFLVLVATSLALGHFYYELHAYFNRYRVLVQKNRHTNLDVELLS
jgi:hypothetical protein